MAAGHSQLLKMFHLEELLLVTHLLNTPHNSFLIAPISRIMVVKVDGRKLPLIILKKIHSKLPLDIHSNLKIGKLQWVLIIQEEDNANTKMVRELVSFLIINMSQQITLTLLKMLFLQVLSLFLSMQHLLLSFSMQVVLLPHLHADKKLITKSRPSDTAPLLKELSFSSSRIRGVNIGVKTVTSRSLPVTPTIVVSLITHLMSS